MSNPIKSLSFFDTTKYQRHQHTLLIFPKEMVNIITFLHNHTCELNISWVIISLYTKLPKQLQLFQRPNKVIRAVRSNFKKLFYFETKKQASTKRFASFFRT